MLYRYYELLEKHNEQWDEIASYLNSGVLRFTSTAANPCLITIEVEGNPQEKFIRRHIMLLLDEHRAIDKQLLEIEEALPDDYYDGSALA